MATQAMGWQKEREAKQKQKEWEAQQNSEHQDWQQKRNDMIKKKEAAELQAKESEEKAPEFLKKLGTMKEKAQNKPAKKEDEGPTIEELDDGTDIPPWHRPNAPEKPEWVVLLIMAAEKEALEEEMDDESVYVGGGGDSDKSLKFDYLPGKDKDNGASGDDDQPEWMKQARNLRSASTFETHTAKPRRSSSFNTSQQSTATQPWMVSTLKPSPKPTNSTHQPPTTAAITPSTPLKLTKRVSASKSLNASLVMPGDDKPEWMLGAEKIRSKKKATAAGADTSTAAPLSPKSPKKEPTQPEWMRQRSKIKQKAPISPVKAATSPESTKSTAPLSTAASVAALSPPLSPKSPQKEPAQPEWMRQRSKIKQKGPLSPKKGPTSPESTTSTASATSKDQQPAWMIQRSKIKQKQSSSPEKPTIETTSNSTKNATARNDDDDKDDQPAFMKHVLKPRISTQELKESKVQEKLDSKAPMRQSVLRTISREELTTSKVKEKLAQRTSYLDKKAQVKPEEMEWMKKKLKPRISVTDGEIPSGSKPLLPEKDGDDDGRPAWMKQRDKIKAKVSPEELQTSKVQEKLQSKEPMRKSSIQLTKEDLTVNKVQEKLHNKQPLRQSVLRTISKDELASSKVQEKLNSKEPMRESTLRRISKKELASNPVKEKLAQRPDSVMDKKPPALAKEMKEARSSLKSSELSRDLTPKLSPEEPTDAGPEAAKEAHKAMSSVGDLDAAAGVSITETEEETNNPPVKRTSGGKKDPDGGHGGTEADEPLVKRKSKDPEASHGGTEPDKPQMERISSNDNDESTEPNSPPAVKRTSGEKDAATSSGGERDADKPLVQNISGKESYASTGEKDTDTPHVEKMDGKNDPATSSGVAEADIPPAKRTSGQIDPPEQATDNEKPEKEPEATKEATRRKSTRRDSYHSDHDADETEKKNSDMRKLRRSSTANEKVPSEKDSDKKKPWWLKDAEKRLSETTKKGVRASMLDDTTKEELKKHGISPADIVTPRKTDGKIDKKSHKEPTAWWKVGPPAQPDSGSISILDDLDALSSDKKSSNSSEPPGDARFWSSLISLDTDALTGGSDGSMDSDSDDDEKTPKQPDFTASMNDISAVMRAETAAPRASLLGSNSLLSLPPRESILGSNSLLPSRAKKIRSRSGSIKKDKKKSDKKKDDKKEKKKKDKKKDDKKEKKKKKKEST